MSVVAACLITLALVHSVLGERRVIGPLLALDLPISMSPVLVSRLIRFVWHALSLAWVGLAVVALGGSWSAAMVIASGLPGLALFSFIRGHLAWPLFLLAALAAARADGYLDDRVFAVAGSGAAVALGSLALLHGYWAVGGRRWFDSVLPKDDGAQRGFQPRVWMTASVAVALGIFAALLVVAVSGPQSGVVRWLTIAGVGFLIARAVGDGRYVGFTKTVRRTAFATADDRYFTPLVVFLAFGAVAALLR